MSARLARLSLAGLLFIPAAASAQTSRDANLHAFLQTRFAEARANYADSRYVHAFADLNGDGRDEAIVSLQSGYFCGSGGCELRIFTPEGESWRSVAEITISNPPIRVLNTRGRGWRDLAVQVRGGGVSRPREARLRFDGRTYWSNPSLAPATPRGAPGRVLIAADAEGRNLF